MFFTIMGFFIGYFVAIWQHHKAIKWWEYNCSTDRDEQYQKQFGKNEKRF